MATTKRRQKTNVAETSQYIEGSIVRIKLENFLTYDSVEFHPGPNLNVIIGPNGTGKSSIVCAIALGLAAKTAVLARAKDPVDFVRHGCNTAVIELELHNSSGDNWIIKREINKKGSQNQKDSSKWSVNDRPASMRAVEDKVKQLNIQVGNLCQFLPQDKVAEFAKMTNQELLENTEKAVGGQEMYDLHQKLKMARENGRELELDYERNVETLKREKAQNGRLEQDVKNYHERAQHMQRIQILQMKKPWVMYEDKRKEYVAEKDKKENLEKEVKDAQKLNAPLKMKLDAAAKSAQGYEVKKKKKDEDIRNQAKLAAAKSKEIEDLDEKMQDSQVELKNKRDAEKKRSNKLRDLNTQIESLETELASLDTTDVQPEIDRVSEDIRKVNRDLTRITQDGEISRASHRNLQREVTANQTELRRLQDVSNQKLDLLRRRSKDAYDAVLWLREHLDEFEAKVHEPIMTVVNVTDPIHAKYVENHIPAKEMFAFVCENERDTEKLMKELKDKQNLNISAVMAPGSSAVYKPNKPIGQYRRFGFFSYLKDMFTCPDAVMRYLCQLYQVHRIPVGDKYTKDHVENVITHCPELTTFYTAAHKYSVKKSKYSGHTSTSCTEVRVPVLLNLSKDSAEEKRIQQSLQAKQAELATSEANYKLQQKKHQELEKQMNELRNEKLLDLSESNITSNMAQQVILGEAKQLSEKKSAESNLQNKIKMKKASITRLEGEGCDLAKEEDVTKAKMKSIWEKKVKLLVDMKSHTKKCYEMSKEKVHICMMHAKSIAEATKLEAQLRDQSQHVKQIENDFMVAKERMKETKASARMLLTNAKKATNTQADEDLSDELRAAFETCPATVEDIDDSIHEVQARADCTMQIDEAVVRDYQKRKREIIKLDEKVTTQKTQLDSHQSDVNVTKDRWLLPLKDLLAKISEKFSNFMSMMRCAGEVDLNIPLDNPEDYEKYGVRIKVKFRDNEPLSELTSYYQSGGEKSVATVLYMMSLQELTHCPFRCVDEINQGMDPTNERKVFELVVRTACREGTSQYFLLTPKLLPDLTYGDRMTIMCVFNGPYMVHHNNWSTKKFIKRRRNIVED